jgi:hypothetical protein
MSNLTIVTSLLKETSVKKLADELNIAPGTITRWIELNDVPAQYEFDLLKLAKIPIDYSKYTSKQKDQFFTQVETARKCFEIFKSKIQDYGDHIDNYTYIEPSAGDGSFLKVLLQGLQGLQGPLEKIIALDIEPRHPTIQQADYLEWMPPSNEVPVKYVVFGNPPFGLRGHLALKFINHSAHFADYVCFILPQLFESDGKGVPRKRVKGFHLLHSQKLDATFYEPDGKEIKINTIFQIWSKNHINDEYDIQDFTNENMRVYSMSDGGTVATTRNKNMIGKCDVYLPSTCFGKENVKCYTDFEDLPGRKGYGVVFHKDKTNMLQQCMNIKWEEIAFLSTNSAYNLRSSQIYSLFK